MKTYWASPINELLTVAGVSENVDSVVDVSHKLGIATKVARLVPIGVIKG